MTAKNHFEIMDDEIQKTIFCKSSIGEDTFTEAMYIIIKGMSKNILSIDNEIINDNLEGFLSECRARFGEKTKDIPMQALNRLYKTYNDLYKAMIIIK